MELSEEQIEKQVNKPLPLEVKFYHQPVVKDTINGVNIYEPRLMAEVKVKGENSSISKVATPELQREYHQQLASFKARLFEGLTPLCAITDQMTAQSLIDMGIKSVDDLATSEPLPLFDHLREQARKLLEIKNAHQDRREHNHNQEGLQGRTETSTDRAGQIQGHDKAGQQHVRIEAQKENHQEVNQKVNLFEFNYSL